MRLALTVLVFVFFSVFSLEAQVPDSLLIPIDVLGFQDIKKLTKKVDEVYSALRYAKESDELPFTVYVITKEEIRRNGFQTLVDVLKLIPGIKTSQPGSAEDGETFLMRGRIGNSYTKILLNSIPIQPSMMGGLPIAAQLPIRQAERIEIIFGASSANYGADAATGIINIITREIEKNFFATAESSMGQYGYQSANFTAGGRVGKNRNVLKYSFFGGYSSRQDQNIKDNSNRVYSPLGIFLVRDISENIPFRDAERLFRLTIEDFRTLGLEAQDVFGEKYQGDFLDPRFGQLAQSSSGVGGTLSYKGLTVSYHHMQRKEYPSIGRSTALYRFADPHVYYGDIIQRSSINYIRRLNKSELTTNISFLNYRLDRNSAFPVNYEVFGNPEGKSYVYGGSDDVFVEQLVTYLPKRNWEFTAGVSYQFSGNLPKTNELAVPFDPSVYKPFSLKVPAQDSVYSKVFGNFGYYPNTFYNWATFLQTYYTRNRFSLILGARFDQNSFYNSAINPRVAALFKLMPKFNLRASFGTAFKAPAFFLAYNSLGIRVKQDSMIYAIVPNENLRPEKFLSAEIGFRLGETKKSFLDASVFINEISNSISGVIVTLDTARFRGAILGREPSRSFRNSAGISTLYGFQFQAKTSELWRVLDIDASISFALGSEVLPDNNERINDFRMQPRTLAKAFIAYKPSKHLYFGLRGEYASPWVRRYTPTQQNYTNSFFINESHVVFDAHFYASLNQNFRITARCTNFLDTRYGGIGATGLDIDLFNNPQLGRNIQIGLQFVIE
jgi:hemoglobin/transferrin/lactoferrin receptor protein